MSEKEKVTINIDEISILSKLGLKALIRAKSATLSSLRKMELELLGLKHDLAEKERTIVLTTDFKDLGLSNDKLRNAYINEKLSKSIEEVDAKKHAIIVKKDDIEIINDLIRFNELKITGE